LRPLESPHQNEEAFSPSQMSEPELDSSLSFQAGLPWPSDQSYSLDQLQSLHLIGSPDVPFATSPVSTYSQDTDFDSAGFGLTDEQLSDLWRAAVNSDGSSTFDLSEYSVLLDTNALFVPQS
jgi:hypothetical protein